jgi:hypothetical protein
MHALVNQGLQISWNESFRERPVWRGIRLEQQAHVMIHACKVALETDCNRKHGKTGKTGDPQEPTESRELFELWNAGNRQNEDLDQDNNKHCYRNIVNESV